MDSPETAPPTPLSISEVKIRLVPAAEDGLVGWASCVVNGALYLNNIAIRHSLNGAVILTYPCKKSKRDQKYFIFNPINRQAKEAMDDAILGSLRKLRAP